MKKNQTVLISDLWKQQPVLFVFLRHFACIACRAHAVEVWKEKKRYESKGLQLFAGGHRQGKMEKDIGDLWQLGGIVLIDKGGKLLYQYASSSTSDYPKPDEILSLV